MVEWHSIQFGIPVLSSLTDEQLGELYFSRDGRWSPQMKAAMRRFKAEKLDLDDNWASQAPDWRCPGCDRVKRDLLRVSEAGILLARLDIHHDHLTDLLKSKLYGHFGPKWPEAIPPDTIHIEKLGAQMVARFEPTVVCIDCNSADGIIKARVRDIPRSFSFRPSEIRRFIRAHPNMEHEVDVHSALIIFEEAKPDFNIRISIVDMLYDIMIKGNITCERGNPWLVHGSDELLVYKHLHSWFSRSCPKDYTSVSQDLRGFQARSVSRDGVASNSKKVTQRPAARPTPEEVDTYDGGGAPDLWKAAPSDWCCPGCKRNRIDILRRSKNPNRHWAGKLVRHIEYISINENEEFLIDPCIDRHEHHLICLDCSTIMSGVKSRHPDISASDAIFQLVDFAAIAVAAPNQPHDVDWPRAADCARASLHFAKLVKNYEELRSTAVGCRSYYRYFLKVCKGDAAWAWSCLINHYSKELSGVEDMDEYLEYLLIEADRTDIVDPYRKIYGKLTNTE